MEPAPRADDPACAEVIARLPESIDGQQRVWTDAQSTGAWGESSPVQLTCGFPPLDPTTLPCVTVDNVDWVIDDSNAPRYVLRSYGRDPAVELYLNTEVVSSRDALEALGLYVNYLSSTGRRCISSDADL